MGNVIISHGIGYSTDGRGSYIDMDAVLSKDNTAQEIRQLKPDEKLDSRPWSKWGENNLKPIEYSSDIESTGILNSIIDIKMRLGVCNGPKPVIMRTDEKTGQEIIEKYIDDAEIKDFLDANNLYWQSQAWIKDQLGMAQGVCRYGLNKKKTPQIVVMERHDVVEFRYQKKNDRGYIDNIFLSANWDKVNSDTDKRVLKVPLLRFNNPSYDLDKKIAGGLKNEVAMTFRYPGWNKHYYSVPLWMAAYKWVKIAQSVPEMKAVMFENNMRVKYVVIIHETYWSNNFDDWQNFTEAQKMEKKEQVWTMIDKLLVGSKNAYKSIFTTGFRNPVDGKIWSEIEIKPVEDSTRQGELLPDSAAANSEIAFAMHFNNSIIGGNQKGGLYQQESGGSSIREAGLLQVILMELERHNVRRLLSVPKKRNGWDKKYPGLEFIIPATVLTTLDTGSGSKPVVTGDAKTKKDVTDKDN